MEMAEEVTVGARIRRAREEAGMAPEDLAHRLEIPLKFILALEEGQFAVFPARIYARSFLKKYASAVAPEDADKLLVDFEKEWEHTRGSIRAPLPRARSESAKRFAVTPRIIGLGLSLILAGALLIFSIPQITRFIARPAVVIEMPLEGEVFFEPRIEIRGTTARESRLTINGREIFVDGEGNFHDWIELPPGRNLLEFVVENKFNKTNAATRNVVVK